MTKEWLYFAIIVDGMPLKTIKNQTDIMLQQRDNNTSDRRWTREETMIAFNAYCKIPFKNSSKTHPLVIKYAKLIGRTPSALNMKIGNIGRLDPSLKTKGIVGLSHGAKLEEEIWGEFNDDPEDFTYKSEMLVAKMSGKSIEDMVSIGTEQLPEGKEREVIVKQRVNQSFFRASVMSAYDFHCCITKVGVPELVEACHIVDWSQDIANRTNPRNGLCMNSFFHRAYDKHLMSITPDMTIVISDRLIDNTLDSRFKEYLAGLDGKRISCPDKFPPKQEFLEIHYSEYLGSKSAH